MIQKKRNEELGGKEVAALQQENRVLRDEVERLRELLEKCPEVTAESRETVFEVRKMKGHIAQLNRQHFMMNNEIKKSRRLAAECEVILADFSTKVQKVTEVDGVQEPEKILECLSEVRAWSLKMLCTIKRKVSNQYNSQTREQQSRDYIVVGGNNCIKAIGEQPTTIKVFDGFYLSDPTVQMWMHQIHEEVLCLSPHMLRQVATLQILLPALHSVGDSFKQQLVAETESVAAGLSKVLGLVSDLALLIPSYVVSPGERFVNCYAARTESRVDPDLTHRKQLENLSRQLQQWKMCKRCKQAPEIQRILQLLQIEIERREQLQLSIDRLQHESCNRTKDLHDLASTIRNQQPENLPDLSSLTEIIQIVNALKLLPSEALVQKLVHTLLYRLEDLTDIPNRISTHLSRTHKALETGIDRVLGGFVHP